MSVDAKQVHLSLGGILFGACVGIYAIVFNDLLYKPLHDKEFSLILLLASFIVMLRFWYNYITLFLENAPSRYFTDYALDFTLPFIGFQGVFSLVTDSTQWFLWFAGVYLLAALKYHFFRKYPKISDKHKKGASTWIKVEISIATICNVFPGSKIYFKRIFA